MFSEEFRNYTKEKLGRRGGLDFGTLAEEVTGKLDTLEGDEKLLMEFLYATMPLRDVGEYDFQIWKDYVDHALFLRKEVDRCKNMPEDMFLHYVFYPRVNSEDIRPCRAFFYEQLKDRTEGLSDEEATLAVNYWCAEQASYGAADQRTLSPMGVYSSGSGRCGEESTFTVSALRSVGIPARQVYTPWWAHCDDNHAWVEVYVQGKWSFLGACEPEEVLNKGWFLGASSRALLVHSRTFFDYWLPENPIRQDYVVREGSVYYYNSTALYAKTGRLMFTVKYPDGKPAHFTALTLSTLNMAEYGTLTRLYVNQKGEAQITLGLGDVHVCAQLGSYHWESWCKVTEGDTMITIDLKKAVYEEETSTFTVEAPEEFPVNQVVLTPQQRTLGKVKLVQAGERRKQKIADSFDGPKAAVYPKETEILQTAAGNFEEIYTFLSKDANPDRAKLLHALLKKDYKDAKAAVLEGFVHNPYLSQDKLEEMGIVNGYKEECYVNYLLNPRIYFEELTDYGSFIRTRFTEKEAEAFRANPINVWEYVSQNTIDMSGDNYHILLCTPVGCMKMKQGNVLSRRILFVAICRSFGIPARLNTVSLEPEYFKGGIWYTGTCGGCDFTEEFSSSGNQQSDTGLILRVKDGSKWTYHQTWTIAKLRIDNFKTLQYDGAAFQNNELRLTLDPGTYRIMTTSRMPSGNQHGAVQIVKLSQGEQRIVPLSLYEGELSDLLCHYQVPDFEITASNSGMEKELLSQKMGDKSGILAFLEVGKEPTEHVLNEMLEKVDELPAIAQDILFVLHGPEDLENQTLGKVLTLLPQIQICYDPGFGNAEPTARKMYVDPERLPLLVVLGPALTGVYGCSGYNVGSVGMMLRLLHQIKDGSEA